MPTDGSLGDDLDEPLSPVFPDDQPLTPSDDSDIYSHIDNDEEEHLVKPSQLKKQHKFQQGKNIEIYVLLLKNLLIGWTDYLVSRRS